jgi:hypothetical protein
VREPTNVSSANGTAEADVSHFTMYTLMADIQPADFTLSGLSVAPAKINVGEKATVNIKVTNTGALSGSYQVVLKLNDVASETKTVTLKGGVSTTVSFTITPGASGQTKINIGDLAAVLEVAAAPTTVPPTTPAATTPTTSLTPPPTSAPPTTLTATTTTPPTSTGPLPPPPSSSATNWGLIIGIIAVVILAGLLVFFLVRTLARRR